jgi:hypothetical protein
LFGDFDRFFGVAAGAASKPFGSCQPVFKVGDARLVIFSHLGNKLPEFGYLTT